MLDEHDTNQNPAAQDGTNEGAPAAGTSRPARRRRAASRPAGPAVTTTPAQSVAPAQANSEQANPEPTGPAQAAATQTASKQESSRRESSKEESSRQESPERGSLGQPSARDDQSERSEDGGDQMLAAAIAQASTGRITGTAPARRASSARADRPSVAVPQPDQGDQGSSDDQQDQDRPRRRNGRRKAERPVNEAASTSPEQSNSEQSSPEQPAADQSQEARDSKEPKTRTRRGTRKAAAPEVSSVDQDERAQDHKRDHQNQSEQDSRDDSVESRLQRAEAETGARRKVEGSLANPFRVDDALQSLAASIAGEDEGSEQDAESNDQQAAPEAEQDQPRSRSRRNRRRAERPSGRDEQVDDPDVSDQDQDASDADDDQSSRDEAAEDQTGQDEAGQDEEQNEGRGSRRGRSRRGKAQDEQDEDDSAADDEATSSDDEAATDDAEDDEDEGSSPSRRRRRRGGRRRRRGTSDRDEDSSNDEDSSDDDEDESDKDETDDDSGSSSSARRRRRRRRRGGDSDDDGNDGAVRVREPRRSSEVTGIEGSTRLEAKRQRRKEGRAAGRRRTPILTEAEFLARRESVKRSLLVRRREDYNQLAVIEDGVLVEHYVDRANATSLIGNVYLGKVQNVLPGMEAAFIDIGRGRNAVLYAGEVDWDQYGVSEHGRKIEQVFKSGQSVLVQVSKDPVGQKGARLTGHISIPGRFVVYSPGGQLSGISRKLADTERHRLKDILNQVVDTEASVIVRTAAEGASEDELVRDVTRLKAQWEAIEKKAKQGAGPRLLYSEPDLTVRIVRDLFNEDFSELVISGDEVHENIHDYIEHVAPNLLDRVQRWDFEAQGDIFTKYRVDEQIAKALERKVYLPSGGSLVIDRTEAMTVVDVNTGRFTGTDGNLEATVTANNLEAAEEIVRQLRLRDIGGIIVIDFIDMVLPANRDLLLRRLVECLGRDRTRHQVAEVTSLGLVQMTRKKIGTGLSEAFTEECEACGGRGYHRFEEPVDSQAPADGGDRQGRGGRDRRSRKNDAGRGESGRNESGKNETGKNETGKNDAGKGGQHPKDAGKKGANRHESSTDEGREAGHQQAAEPVVGTPVEQGDSASSTGGKRGGRKKSSGRQEPQAADVQAQNDGSQNDQSSDARASNHGTTDAPTTSTLATNEAVVDPSQTPVVDATVLPSSSHPEAVNQSSHEQPEAPRKRARRRATRPAGGAAIPDSQSPDSQSPDSQSPDSQVAATRGAEAQVAETQGAQTQTAEFRGAESEVAEPQTPEPQSQVAEPQPQVATTTVQDQLPAEQAQVQASESVSNESVAATGPDTEPGADQR